MKVTYLFLPTFKRKGLSIVGDSCCKIGSFSVERERMLKWEAFGIHSSAKQNEGKMLKGGGAKVTWLVGCNYAN